MLIDKFVLIKFIFVVSLVFVYFITRYYHSFYQGDRGYGSGDAYTVMLDAYTVQPNRPDEYLVSYFYKIAHEMTSISYYQISFYVTPIIGLLIILILFDLTRREIGFIPASIMSIVVVLNPWLAYHSTEPSKEIFVILFTLFSFYCLFRYAKSHLYMWLILSLVFFGIGTGYYHSSLLFLPIYIFFVGTIIYKSFRKHGVFRQLLIIGITFSVVMALVLGSQNFIKKINYNIASSQKPISLQTNIDEGGNVFKRQIKAMLYALTVDRNKLGVTKLIEGVDTFILKQKVFFVLFPIVLITSFFLFRKRGMYFPLFFSLLTLYIFLIIGVQWTSYSHSSRYPQYVVYFFLLCVSLPLAWTLKLFSNHFLKMLILSLFVVSFILIFNPLLKVDYFRDIYNPHLKIGQSAKKSGVILNEKKQVLFIGWPSISLSLLEELNMDNTAYFNTFGWGLTDLSGISSEKYIKEKNIRYFVYNNRGSDYYDSNNIVYKKLNENFELTPIYSVDKEKTIVIYQIIY